MEDKDVPFPVFNVARSETKLTQESPIIARQIFERTLEYTTEKNIQFPRTVIVGLGPIGSSVLQIFETNGCSVIGFDIEISKEALLSYLSEEKPDVVIGATGSPLFTTDDLVSIDNGHAYYFISVSSSDREFPVATYRNKEGVHEDVHYKNVTFVNNGFPISFKGNRNELTPIEIEKTIGLLMGSIFHGIVYPSDKKGLIDVPTQLQNLIGNYSANA